MRLHHVRRGAGERLLLVQGLSGTHAAWGEPFLEALARDFDVVAYDHRGVGKSPRVEAPFTIADLADDAAGLLDDLGWQDAHVLGISMGGMVAQEIALRHPSRVRTLVLGCTYPGPPEGRLTHPDVIRRLGEALASGDRERSIRTGYEVNLSPSYRADETRWPAFREMVLTVPVAVGVILMQMEAARGHDAAARLGAIAAPTLVVHGTADEMLAVENGRAIASLVPGSRLVEMEGVGHLFWWERPEESAALVRAHALRA